MHIRGNPLLRQRFDDGVALLQGLPFQTSQIQVAAGDVLPMEMGRAEHRCVRQQAVILPHQGVPLLQQIGIPFQLGQADGGHDIRHIAFIEGRHDIVLPGTRLGLGQGILVLPMEAHQHILLVDRAVIKAQIIPPGGGPTLSSSQVLDGVERERGEIRDAAGALYPSPGTEAVGTVGHDGHPAQLCLDLVGRYEQGFFSSTAANTRS